MTAIRASHRKEAPLRPNPLMWLLYLADAGLLVTSGLIHLHLLVVLAAAALMAGTMVGFVLARTVGIFGFHLTFSSGLAWTVLIVEAAGVVMLLLTAGLLWQRR